MVMPMPSGQSVARTRISIMASNPSRSRWSNRPRIRRIEIEHPKLATGHLHWNDDLTRRGGVASNVPWKLMDVSDDNGRSARRGGSANTSPLLDAHASRLPLKGTQDQLAVSPKIKTDPVERWQPVVEQSRSVGEVRDPVALATQQACQFFTQRTVVAGSLEVRIGIVHDAQPVNSVPKVGHIRQNGNIPLRNAGFVCSLIS